MMLRQLRGLRAGRFRFEVFQGVTLNTDEHADVFLHCRCAQTGLFDQLADDVYELQ